MVSPIGRHQKKLVTIDLCYTIYLFMDASLLLPIISYSWREGGREFSLADLVFGSHFIVKLVCAGQLRCKPAGTERERQIWKTKIPVQIYTLHTTKPQK